MITNHRTARRLLPPLVKFSTLCGGFLNQFGWFFLGIGMIFAWLFVGNSDLRSLFIYGPVDIVQGTIKAYRDTGASEGGGGSSDGDPVYKSFFEFTYQGELHDGVSYNTGTRPVTHRLTEIEVPEGRPDLAIVRGERRAIFDLWACCVLIFPGVGLGFLAFGFRRSRKALRLLRVGEVAEAKFVRKEATYANINNQPVYRVMFEYQARDGQTYSFWDKTHEIELLEDDPLERLVYDPHNPENAMLFDVIPGKPTLTLTGQVQAAKGAALLFVIPGVSILGHGAYLMHWLKI
ncbi:DUF3592 domain-containing protein [Oligoflexia bacterium]|nr:DUF3592 domain-containing protein [Oligoflexia bacterium]